MESSTLVLTTKKLVVNQGIRVLIKFIRVLIIKFMILFSESIKQSTQKSVNFILKSFLYFLFKGRQSIPRLDFSQISEFCQIFLKHL